MLDKNDAASYLLMAGMFADAKMHEQVPGI